jgi:hypothetical protein
METEYVEKGKELRIYGLNGETTSLFVLVPIGGNTGEIVWRRRKDGGLRTMKKIEGEKHAGDIFIEIG